MSEDNSQSYNAEKTLILIIGAAALVAVMLAIVAAMLIHFHGYSGQVMAPASPGSAPSMIAEHNGI